MYNFQEVFCTIDNDLHINKDSFVYTYGDYIFCFNHDYYSSHIKEIFYFFDKNWEENLKNYIKKNKPRSSFTFKTREITEEDLFYWKLKLPNDIFDNLFNKSNFYW